LATADDPTTRSRNLLWHRPEPGEIHAARTHPDTVAIFSLRFAGPGILAACRLLDAQADAPAKGEEVWWFYRKVAEPSVRFNGGTYIDALSAAAVEKFLHITLDAYATRYGADFGAAIPGVFTDEPAYETIGNKDGGLLPWTDAMPDVFRHDNGYDLVPLLPFLAWDGDRSRKVRHDFCRTLLLRYLACWSRPYFERCEQLGLKLTGHYLGEETLALQPRFHGAAMPHYEYMHVPGVDHLGLNISNPLKIRQVVSVARQLGRTAVLSELFGGAGADATFEDLKWIADWHLALGVTMLCPHLIPFTMSGVCKRDWPPSLGLSQPYWRHLRLLNDYFTRAGWLLQQGRPTAGILVLHNIGSAWSDYRFSRVGWEVNNELAGTTRWNDALTGMAQNLLELHRDFDLGDETILERHGRVGASDELEVGTAGRYRLVIVPESLTWFRSTVDLLRAFLAAGGRVLFAGEPPVLINAEPGEAVWRDVLAHPNTARCEPGKASLEAAIAAVLPRRVGVHDAQGGELADILVNERVVEEAGRVRRILFLANTSRERTHRAVVRVPGAARAEVWRLDDGTTVPAPARSAGPDTEIPVILPPVGSLTLVLKDGHPGGVRTETPAPRRLAVLTGPWTHARLHPNTLSLCLCSFCLDGGEWTGPVPVWEVRSRVVAAGLGANAGLQPWKLIKSGVKPAPVRVELRFEFESRLERKVAASLVVERGDLWRMRVNGTAIVAGTDWQWDPAFRKADISGLLRSGDNVIELETVYSLDTPIEGIYIVGEFGARVTDENRALLIEEPRALTAGDWTAQGYPCYAGTMRYAMAVQLPPCSEGQRVLVRLVRPAGILFRVRMNGGAWRAIAWQEEYGWTADMTDSTCSGDNQLEIEVVNSLRNAMVPYCGENPIEFNTSHIHRDGGRLKPCGLLECVEVLCVTDAWAGPATRRCSSLRRASTGMSPRFSRNGARTLRVHVTVPPNTTATVILPGRKAVRGGAGRHEFCTYKER
jgi:hypothetical protein